MSLQSQPSLIPAGMVVAIDPGRGKCGLAVLKPSGEPLFQKVVATPELGDEVCRVGRIYPMGVIVIGNRTGAREVLYLIERLRLGVPIELVDEHHSSEEGRRRFFAANPPRGWRRLLPVSLQTPSRPHDDYVAIVLGERYLRQKGEAGED